MFRRRTPAILCRRQLGPVQEARLVENGTEYAPLEVKIGLKMFEYVRSLPAIRCSRHQEHMPDVRSETGLFRTESISWGWKVEIK